MCTRPGWYTMNKDEPYGRIASSMLKKQRRKNGGMGVRGGEEER